MWARARILSGWFALAMTVAAALVAAPSAAAAATEDPDNSLLLLLDASGSMAGSVGGGQTRIAAAKKALNSLVTDLPNRSNVGLRVYGATKDHGCDDTTLVSPIGPLDRPGLRQAIRGFQPRGDTPIGRSLKAAANDLEGAPGRKTVVLVSDGETPARRPHRATWHESCASRVSTCGSRPSASRSGLLPATSWPAWPR